MKVAVTGASGYIGGQIVLTLLDAGHSVLGIDRRCRPEHLAHLDIDFVQDDFDSGNVYSVLREYQPDAIIHCAGTSLVGPSIQHPSDYYNNNVVKTMHLLDFILAAVPKTRIIFSSSAAVYGTPVMNPCHEVDLLEPISPYGESKLMVEMMLASYRRAYGLDYVAFRYFNAAGADSRGRHGQEPGATHIVARLLEATRDETEFTLNGIHYPTKDGTCIRDYVHVEDIARAHLLALDPGVKSDVYNLGTSTGVSNNEIIVAAQTVTGRSVVIHTSEAREGDPAVLTASADKFNRYTTEWQRYSLDDIIRHAWAWYNK